MEVDNLFAELRTLMEIHFIQQALFEMVAGNSAYDLLLVVNHRNRFLSLSNEDHYIFLMPVINPQTIAEVMDHNKFIFNRKKILVQLEHSGDSADIEVHFCLPVSAIIRQSKEAGVKENNLFLRRLSELFGSSEAKS